MSMETKQYLGQWGEVPVSYCTRDLLLYAIGIGEEKRKWVLLLCASLYLSVPLCTSLYLSVPLCASLYLSVPPS